MKKGFSHLFFIAFILRFFADCNTYAQDVPTYGKNAISFDLTRMAVNEVNMGIEHFFSYRKSIEISGGVVYANDFLADQANDWSNAQEAFSEHGYALRFHYKIFRRTDDVSKWRNYISPGLTFRDVYYNDKPVTTDLKPDYIPNDTLYYTETFLRKRERMIFGIDFLWGKVYEASRTFGFEFYFGARLDGTMATRTDHERYATYQSSSNQWRNQSIPDYVDESFYLRPIVQAGIKLRMRF